MRRVSLKLLVYYNRVCTQNPTCYAVQEIVAARSDIIIIIIKGRL